MNANFIIKCYIVEIQFMLIGLIKVQTSMRKESEFFL